MLFPSSHSKCCMSQTHLFQTHCSNTNLYPLDSGWGVLSVADMGRRGNYCDIIRFLVVNVIIHVLYVIF